MTQYSAPIFTRSKTYNVEDFWEIEFKSLLQQKFYAAAGQIVRKPIFKFTAKYRDHMRIEMLMQLVIDMLEISSFCRRRYDGFPVVYMDCQTVILWLEQYHDFHLKDKLMVFLRSIELQACGKWAHQYDHGALDVFKRTSWLSLGKKVKHRIAYNAKKAALTQGNAVVVGNANPNMLSMVPQTVTDILQ